MKKILILFAVLFFGRSVFAADIFFAQASAGANNGSSCANARATSSLAAGDWTAGNVLHLCGTLTTAVTALASGASGNVITVKFESGAGFSFAAVPTTGALVFDSQSHFLVDGGGGSCGYVSNSNVTCTGGFIKSTANGSGLANQIASIAIHASSTTDLEVKGMVLGPIYTHTSTSDLTQSPPGPIAVYFPSANTVNIHNNTIHDCAWCVNGNAPSTTIANNEIYNVDHGVGLGGTMSATTIHDNHIHDMVTWDTSNNSFHHDAIHVFDAAGQTTTGVDEFNNLFDGDQGSNVTALIYNEHSSPTGTISNFRMWNNVAIAAANRFSSVGWLSCFSTAGSGTGSSCSAYDNTIIGQYIAGSGSCLVSNNWTTPNLENNVLVGCQNLISIQNFTTLGTVDYNEYENLATDHGCGTGCNTFTFGASTNFASFTTWKTDCSCDSHGRQDANSAINVNAIGRQQSGSTLIGNGLNLSSLSIGALDSDITGNARPAGSTAWDIGAYFGQFVVSSSQVLTAAPIF